MPMTPDQFRAAGVELNDGREFDWQARLSPRVGLARRTLRQYTAGDRAIPEPLAKLLAALLREHKRRSKGRARKRA